MISFTIKNTFFSFKCEISNGTLLTEGTVENKYKLLKFSTGNSCRLGGKLTHIKDISDLLVTTGEGTSSFERFLVENARTETCLRIEKEGFGPYSCKNVSPSYRQWVAKQLEQAQIRRWNGEEENQPSLAQDRELNIFAPHVDLFNFAFNSYEQLWQWFKLEEIQKMRQEGFELVTKQKGRDYFGSFHSKYQSLLVKTEEDYQFLRHLEQSHLVPYY